MKKFIKLTSIIILTLIICALTACGAGDNNKSNTEKTSFTLGTYSSVDLFSEGLALVKNDNQLSYIDSKGNCIIELDKNVVDGGPFKEGKAWIKFNDGKGGYIKNNGEYITEMYSGFGLGNPDDYSGGLVAVSQSHAYGVDCFIIDSAGKKSNLFKEYKNIGEYGGFSENISCFTDDGSLYGYVKDNGEKITEQIYQQASDFHCGRARVVDENGIHIIDSDGTVVFSLRAEEDCSNYSDNILKISNDTGFYYVDTNGNRIINNNYEKANDFSNGLATVKKDEKISVIDKNGNVVFSAPEGITDIGMFSGKNAIFTRNNKYGIIDSKGKIIIEECFDHVKGIGENMVSCSIDSLWGFVAVN